MPVLSLHHLQSLRCPVNESSDVDKTGKANCLTTVLGRRDGFVCDFGHFGPRSFACSWILFVLLRVSNVSLCGVCSQSVFYFQLESTHRLTLRTRFKTRTLSSGWARICAQVCSVSVIIGADLPLLLLLHGHINYCLIGVTKEKETKKKGPDESG